MIDEKTQELLDLMSAKHELENDLFKLKIQIIEILQGLSLELPIEVLFDVDDHEGFIEAVEDKSLLSG